MKVFKYVLLLLMPLVLYGCGESESDKAVKELAKKLAEDEQRKKEEICASEEFRRKHLGSTKPNPYYKCDFHEE